MNIKNFAFLALTLTIVGSTLSESGQTAIFGPKARAEEREIKRKEAEQDDIKNCNTNNNNNNEIAKNWCTDNYPQENDKKDRENAGLRNNCLDEAYKGFTRQKEKCNPPK